LSCPLFCHLFGGGPLSEQLIDPLKHRLANYWIEVKWLAKGSPNHVIGSGGGEDIDRIRGDRMPGNDLRRHIRDRAQIHLEPNRSGLALLSGRTLNELVEVVCPDHIPVR
jgi:hypothetical protein